MALVLLDQLFGSTRPLPHTNLASARTYSLPPHIAPYTSQDGHRQVSGSPSCTYPTVQARHAVSQSVNNSSSFLL